jgi:hypothetical protein
MEPWVLANVVVVLVVLVVLVVELDAVGAVTWNGNAVAHVVGGEGTTAFPASTWSCWGWWEGTWGGVAEGLTEGEFPGAFLLVGAFGAPFGGGEEGLVFGCGWSGGSWAADHLLRGTGRGAELVGDEDDAFVVVGGEFGFGGESTWAELTFWVSFSDSPPGEADGFVVFATGGEVEAHDVLMFGVDLVAPDGIGGSGRCSDRAFDTVHLLGGEATTL